MDFLLNEAEREFRDEVRAFLDAKLTEPMRAGARATTGVFAEPEVAGPWHRALHEQGWAAYSWPAEHGGPGWTPMQRWIFEKETARAHAPALPGMSLKLVGPVLYTFGSQAQKDRFLPRILSGEDFWAQGFSEPGSGSDLASLRTRAVREGDEYVVNGQKIWTTQAQFANWVFTLVRTDPDVKPQRGISFLLIPIDTPGLEVRPIISASGAHELNEVFFEDVRVPVTNLVGEEGQGWTIAKFLLQNERGGTSFAPAIIERLRAVTKGIDADDALLRDRATRIRLDAEALEITELRTLIEVAQGAPPAQRSLVTKLVASELIQAIDELAIDAGLPDALALPQDGEAAPPEQLAAARYLDSRAWTIFGGTSEIQLDIIAADLLNPS